jgi:hypothetical protein
VPLNLSSKEFTLWSPARSLELESSASTQLQIRNVNNNRRLLPQYNQFQMKSNPQVEIIPVKKIKIENESRDEPHKVFPVSQFSFA